MMTLGIQAAHGAIAMLTNTPEMECNEGEAKSIADPLVRLMDHYAVVPPVEVMLAMNLATAVIAVEAPRIVLIRMRKQAEAQRPMKPVYPSTKQPTEAAPDLTAGFGAGGPVPGSVN